MANENRKIDDKRLDRFTWKPGDIIISFPDEESRRKAYGEPKLDPNERKDGDSK